MTTESAPRATFTSMESSTQADWMKIGAQFLAYAKTLPDRVLTHLRLLDGDFGGFPVDRLTHCLQTATRAHRDGRDEEYVVCALLHDIGDTLATYNHPDIAAAILKPFVSEENHWMVAHHAIFQGYYYFHYLGGDRNRRDEFKGHPAYEYTAQFCQLYDQNSFDPDYETMPLSAFEPMVRRVCAAPKRMMLAPAKASA